MLVTVLTIQTLINNNVKDDAYIQLNDHENGGRLYKNNIVFQSRNRSQKIYGIIIAMDFITQFVHLILAAVHSGVSH